MTPEQKLQEAAMMAFPESESRANRAFNFATSPAAQEYWQGVEQGLVEEAIQDVVNICYLNDEDTAKKLISAQFFVCSNEDLPPKTEIK